MPSKHSNGHGNSHCNNGGPNGEKSQRSSNLNLIAEINENLAGENDTD
jgi:hypothetical protein